MQDWDSRIENLKANINDARKRWVLPYLEEVKVESQPAPKVNPEEVTAEAAPTEEAKVSEEAAPAETTAEAAPKVNPEEATAEAAPTEEAKVSEKTIDKPKKGKKKGKQVKPDLVAIELAELEAIEENELTEEQEDRLYELRRVRAQRAMHKEADENFKDEMKKADEEIKELKSQIKPTKAELAKQGLIA